MAFDSHNLKLASQFKAIVLLVSFIAVQVSAESNKAEAEPLLIRGGWLFDGVSDTRRRNSGILIRDGKIVDLDIQAKADSSGYTKVIVLADSDTVLPGMIDLHAHYNLDLVDNGRAEEVVYNGIVLLANGVTSTWSAGEFFPERVIAQRDRIEAGEAVGPRLKEGDVHDPRILLRSAEGKIGPMGPADHANWELKVEPLRQGEKL